ncbi:sigma-70 family RNA polymerase sigma factor [Sphingobacterium sp. T2]|uniref:sigma-70 family RNA polymerase sigma factor n=1 Tax=Sphingobacterium sp. T2 TaxID=1590596 RepID=UPI000689D62D|nr:sigma-70 family RNA polymerase sigma factor [Sphingobacterium sp. T2]
MAKNNNPEFLFVFGSIYPEVMSVFRELAPNMRNSEIYFLALCYLNFTPKEIAKCTNVTVRAVQVRKNRYRKKFNIPSDTDFNLWIYDLNKGHKES